MLRLLISMLGQKNVSHVPFEELGNEFRLNNMANKLANIASDMCFVNKVAEGR